jgi:hypothetical protein
VEISGSFIVMTCKWPVQTPSTATHTRDNIYKNMKILVYDYYKYELGKEENAHVVMIIFSHNVNAKTKRTLC